MANYYGVTRTNYFAVKNADAFREELSKYPVEVITKESISVNTGEKATLYGFIDSDIDGGGNIEYYYDEEAGETSESMVWEEFFTRHLADGWVAVITHSGAEKHRYISGYSTAYNNKGEVIHIDLTDIYTLANDLGENLTHAQY